MKTPALLSVIFDCVFQKMNCLYVAKTSLEIGSQDLRGKTIIVTGATSGIGETTAKTLLLKQARVVLAVRNKKKAERMIERWREEEAESELAVQERDFFWKNCKAMELDLNSLKSVRKFAKKFETEEANLDVLINNAGVFDMSNEYVETEDGYEQHHGTNFVAPALLSLLLVPKMLKTKKERGMKRKSEWPRIVFVSSKMHEFAKSYDMQKRGYWFSAKTAYANSKMAEIAFAKVLERKLCEFRKRTTLANSPIKMISLHPGNIITNVVKTLPKFIQFLYRTTMRQILFNCDEGARATIYCATSEKAYEESKNAYGSYFDSACKLVTPNSFSEEKEEKLWAGLLEEFGMREEELESAWKI